MRKMKSVGGNEDLAKNCKQMVLKQKIMHTFLKNSNESLILFKCVC